MRGMRDRQRRERDRRAPKRSVETVKAVEASNCPPMPVSAYWPNENERGWYDARMFELYEDTACVEYADYPGKNTKFLVLGCRVKSRENKVRQGIEFDDTEMLKDAAAYRSSRDAEVENRDIMRDAAAFGLHQGIEGDDTEMLKDAAAFRVHQGIEIDDKIENKDIARDAAAFRVHQGIEIDDEIENKDIVRDAAAFRVHQGIEVDSEMFKDAAAYRSSHDTAEVESREKIKNKDDTKQ